MYYVPRINNVLKNALIPWHHIWVAKEPLTYAGLSSKKGNCDWHMQYGDEKIRVLADGLSTSTFMILFISCKFARPYFDWPTTTFFLQEASIKCSYIKTAQPLH